MMKVINCSRLFLFLTFLSLQAVFSTADTENTFLFFNACPHFTFLAFKYGEDPLSLTSEISFIDSGFAFSQTVLYSQVYYEMYKLDEAYSLILLYSSYFNITNANLNAIGYALNPNNVCEMFQYTPTNTSLSSFSVAVYINAAKIDKQVFVGSTFQGIVTPHPNTYLQITSTSPLEYSKTIVQFCNTSCSSTYNGTVHVPIGSAVFFINYYPASTSISSSVTTGGTGSTLISYSCEDNDGCWFFDDDFHVFDYSAVIGGVLGGIGCCLLGGLGYAHYRYRQKKNDPANFPLKV